MHRRMKTVLHIRKSVLGITQGEMAKIASTRQATVSRWETGELLPDIGHMRAIRNEVARRGLAWDDSWFFEIPADQPAA